MPSHPKTKEKTKEGKHPGGPLKCSGSSADMWDEYVGPSISAIPSQKLPLVKNILQRYRALRIENKSTDTASLASEIVKEVKDIWDKARIPTVAVNNCQRKVMGVIEKWKSFHNPGEITNEYSEQLQQLLDLAPKPRGKSTEEAQLAYLKEIMRQACRCRNMEGDRYDWEIDFEFYIDQAKVNAPNY